MPGGSIPWSRRNLYQIKIFPKRKEDFALCRVLFVLQLIFLFPVSPFFHGLRILLFQAFFQTFTVLFQLGSKFRMFFQNLLTDTASAFLNQFQDMSMFFVQFFWKFIDMQLNSVQDLIFVQSTKACQFSKCSRRPSSDNFSTSGI